MRKYVDNSGYDRWNLLGYVVKNDIEGIENTQFDNEKYPVIWNEQGEVRCSNHIHLDGKYTARRNRDGSETIGDLIQNETPQENHKMIYEKNELKPYRTWEDFTMLKCPKCGGVFKEKNEVLLTHDQIKVTFKCAQDECENTCTLMITMAKKLGECFPSLTFKDDYSPSYDKFGMRYYENKMLPQEELP